MGPIDVSTWVFYPTLGANPNTRAPTPPPWWKTKVLKASAHARTHRAPASGFAWASLATRVPGKVGNLAIASRGQESSASHGRSVVTLFIHLETELRMFNNSASFEKTENMPKSIFGCLDSSLLDFSFLQQSRIQARTTGIRLPYARAMSTVHFVAFSKFLTVSNN